MMDRRDFLKMAATLSTAFGVTAQLPEEVFAALKAVNRETIPKLVYLQGQACTGCSVSLLQAGSPDAATLITDYSKLAFHADLSSASGKQALALIESYVSGQAGDYFLAVEGAVPLDMPSACVIGHKPFEEYLLAAAKTAKGIVAVGTCATHGGIPAAEGNPTGAVSLTTFYEKKNVKPTVISIPGCSVHPDWLWQTIVYLVKVGMPPLQNGSPASFFSRKLHETCPRYHDFQEEVFAKKFGDKGCLFLLGCVGPNTHADCPTRWWNNGTTWCIGANAPCIGCASPIFAAKKSFPMYRLDGKNLKSNNVG